MNRAVSSHIESLGQITAFLLHRTIYPRICQDWLVETVERSQVWSPWKKEAETVNDHPVCSDFSLFYILCVNENLLWIVFSHSQWCEWSCGNWGGNYSRHLRSIDYNDIAQELRMAERDFRCCRCTILWLFAYCTGGIPKQGLTQCTGSLTGDQDKGDKCHSQYLWFPHIICSHSAQPSWSSNSGARSTCWLRGREIANPLRGLLFHQHMYNPIFFP